MSAVQCVSCHRAPGAVLDKVLPDLPVGIGPVNYLVGHEGREAFVKPEVVPPFHRDEIAEPHVSNLVRDYLGNALLCRGARVLVSMQQDLLESYCLLVTLLLLGFNGHVRDYREIISCAYC